MTDEKKPSQMIKDLVSKPFANYICAINEAAELIFGEKEPWRDRNPFEQDQQIYFGRAEPHPNIKPEEEDRLVELMEHLNADRESMSLLPSNKKGHLGRISDAYEKFLLEKEQRAVIEKYQSQGDVNESLIGANVAVEVAKHGEKTLFYEGTYAGIQTFGPKKMVVLKEGSHYNRAGITCTDSGQSWKLGSSNTYIDLERVISIDKDYKSLN